jgi:hypothetical protein
MESTQHSGQDEQESQAAVGQGAHDTNSAQAGSREAIVPDDLI